MNLDKFLSVVQQRSNYTPSSQVNGRVAPHGLANQYRHGEEKKVYQQNNNLTMNQSRNANVDRKKMGQMRLSSNATDLVFA